MIVLLILVAGVLNVVYLFSFYQLMRALERSASTYWAEIGHPKSFSGRDISAVLNNLYTSRMKEAVQGTEEEGVLMRVRVFFPLTVVVSGLAIYVVATILR